MGIPEAELRDAIASDIRQKLFMLAACTSRTGLNTSPSERRVFMQYRATSLRVRSLLKREDVSI
jgi:hypothetical protein